MQDQEDTLWVWLWPNQQMCGASGINVHVTCEVWCVWLEDDQRKKRQKDWHVSDSALPHIPNNSAVCAGVTVDKEKQKNEDVFTLANLKPPDYY